MICPPLAARQRSSPSLVPRLSFDGGGHRTLCGAAYLLLVGAASRLANRETYLRKGDGTTLLLRCLVGSSVPVSTNQKDTRRLRCRASLGCREASSRKRRRGAAWTRPVGIHDRVSPRGSRSREPAFFARLHRTRRGRFRTSLSPPGRESQTSPSPLLLHRRPPGPCGLPTYRVDAV